MDIATSSAYATWLAILMKGTEPLLMRHGVDFLLPHRRRGAITPYIFLRPGNHLWVSHDEGEQKSLIAAHARIPLFGGILC